MRTGASVRLCLDLECSCLRNLLDNFEATIEDTESGGVFLCEGETATTLIALQTDLARFDELL